MYVKVMSGDSLPDEHPQKCFTLYADVDQIDLGRDEEGNVEVDIVNGDMVQHSKPIGNVYCLGDMGAIISVFAVKDDNLFYDSDEAEIH